MQQLFPDEPLRAPELSLPQGGAEPEGALLKRIAHHFVCYSHTEAPIDRTLEVTEAAAEKVWSGAC